ncbi:MAG: hypothetical protein K0Q48_1533 [Bacillota bacterium]|jgi:hypothetical protein|nr:hypothetical protein [Bacillota bacterium]
MKVKSNKTTRYQFTRIGELRCGLCGGLEDITGFKNGYVCTSCLQYVRTL